MSWASLESDADLLPACHSRQLALDTIEDLECEIEWRREQAFMARIVNGKLLLEPDDEPTSVFGYDQPEVRLSIARRRLLEIDRHIADAVMHHLLNPPRPRDEIAVLPPGQSHRGTLRRGA